MPEVLRFGIHSLDELLGAHSGQPRETPEEGDAPHGIYLLKDEKEDEEADAAKDGAGGGGKEACDVKKTITTSVCIVGPNGTGKSIFGLHMASRYLADCIIDDPDRLPAVLYVSTDLTYNMARRAWDNFALDYPFSRKDPFAPPGAAPAGEVEPIRLITKAPTQLAKEFDLVEEKQHRGKVVFVDMASYTAGDDWGFLHKLLALMPMPGADDPEEKRLNAPRHLVVVDAIEGFEALAGEVNAFGEKSTRRSRVAQLMRLSEDKCHTLLVVEKSVKGEGLAEEFIADTVIRLENFSTRNYDRRVLKVEKVRGQSHIRGHHHYSIRSGGGSTTGLQRNPDDPEVPAPVAGGGRRLQSYVQVYHSVHHLNRKIMEIKGAERKSRDEPGHDKFAAFGISYLDSMLGGKEETTKSKPAGGGHYYDTRGLPCSSTTALIGDSLTQKSTLGKAFLSRCFHSFAERLKERRALLAEGRDVDAICGHVREKVEMVSDSPVTEEWESSGREFVERGDWRSLSEYVGRKVGRERMSFTPDPKGGPRESEERLLTRLAAWTLDYKAGQAVMLATHNTHHAKLADDFVRWLRPNDELNEFSRDIPDYEEALKDYIMGGTICRRLEIHSLSSEVLIHIVQQTVNAAQKNALTRKEMSDPLERYRKSWPIRVVIDDFSTFRDIFPELREDPLLLPSILFHFEREGVTTLIVDTQSGKPETPIAERFESELRQMVQHNLYTWRFPFYGESRVAITAIPPFSQQYAGIVRELRWESGGLGQQDMPAVNEPATVDPHFELYTGLEEGRPRPVPLSVRFYAETPAMESYIETQNDFLGELFVPAARQSQTGAASVIVGVPATNYNELRDFAYLQMDTRLDHTLVFQVDEFWALRLPNQRKRSGASHSQWSYLNSVTAKPRAGAGRGAEAYEPDLNVDPYKFFQPREGEGTKGQREVRRRDFYKSYYDDYTGYERFGEEGAKDALHVDRFPFTWDFGFLLCQPVAWDTRRSFKVRGKDEKRARLYTVKDIWDSLKKATKAGGDGGGAEYVSWRMFIEACKKAAEGMSDKLSKQVTAFDFAQISPESFSCLILEVWFSEIYDTLLHRIKEAKGKKERHTAEEDLKSFVDTLSKRPLFRPATEGEEEERAPRLSSLVEEYWLELYKSWLLLIEVINFSDIVGEATALDFDFKSKNTDFSSIASRHWYKTASQCPNEVAARASLVAVRLPGHFSVRGDWFLAVSGSSRSVRQAERALDLFSSRRANVTRLQLGVGLPTRFPRIESVKQLRTKLISHERGQDNVEYETFLKIAETTPKVSVGKKEDFHWLWRSSLADYVHSNRIWHKWLNRMLLSWHRNLLRYKSVWRNSFEVYDELTNNPPETVGGRVPIENFAPTYSELASELNRLDALKKQSPKKFKTEWEEYPHRYKVESLAQVRVRTSFRELLEALKKELEQASEATRGEDDARPA